MGSFFSVAVFYRARPGCPDDLDSRPRLPMPASVLTHACARASRLLRPCLPALAPKAWK